MAVCLSLPGVAILGFCTKPVNILNGIGEFLSEFATDHTGIFQHGIPPPSFCGCMLEDSAQNDPIRRLFCVWEIGGRKKAARGESLPAGIAERIEVRATEIFAKK
jgi:hypothetical protein